MALGLAFTSCSEEDEKLTPSGKEDGYIIAKGEADYDKTIGEFYQKYGSCLLYNWTEKDAYWTPGGWQNGVLGKQNEGGKNGYLVYAPEKEYISKQLHLLDRLWFQFYSDKALQKLLPYKILLCSNVQETKTSYIYEPEFTEVYAGKDVSAHYNYDNIAVSFASNRVENLTVSEFCTHLQGTEPSFPQQHDRQRYCQYTEEIHRGNRLYSSPKAEHDYRIHCQRNLQGHQDMGLPVKRL